MRVFRSKLRFSLRFSLRALFLATFVTALLLQGRLMALQYQREQRREVFVNDIREQLIAAARIEPQPRRRMLAFIERRITQSADGMLLSKREQKQLLQRVQTARCQVESTPMTTRVTATSVPAINQWVWSEADTCPW